MVVTQCHYPDRVSNLIKIMHQRIDLLMPRCLRDLSSRIALPGQSGNKRLSETVSRNLLQANTIPYGRLRQRKPPAKSHPPPNAPEVSTPASPETNGGLPDLPGKPNITIA